MIFSVVFIMFISVAASEDTTTITQDTPTPTTDPEQPNSPTAQASTDTTDPGDASVVLTTIQQITNQQTLLTDLTTNGQTTSWLTQKSTVLATSESIFTTVNSTETKSLVESTSESTFAPINPSETSLAESNSTAYNSALGDREGQDLAGNPGLIAVLSIFCIVVAAVVVVVIVKAVRARRPQFERLDDVSMGKINEDAPFARYPPK